MENYASDNAEMIGQRTVNISELTDTVLVTLVEGLPDNWHHKTFKRKTKVAKDSGGFQFLLNPEKAVGFDVDRLIQDHHRVGFGTNDIIITADVPIPTGIALEASIIKERQQQTVSWFDQMRESISQTVPVLHGQTPREVKEHLAMFGLNDKEMVCLGSNLAQGQTRVMDRVGGGKQRGKKTTKKIPRIKLWERNIECIKQMGENPLFLLGAGGMNAAPIAALLGAEAVDASSWRLNGMMRQIYDTEHGRFIKCGTKQRNIERPIFQDFLKGRLQEEDYPFFGMTVKNLTRAFSANGTIGTEMRSYHNLWETNRDAKVISTFEDDPDGLVRMLEKRWTSSGWTDHQNLKILKMAASAVKHASVPRELANFARAN
jgi:hypothetical protein